MPANGRAKRCQQVASGQLRADRPGCLPSTCSGCLRWRGDSPGFSLIDRPALAAVFAGGVAGTLARAGLLETAPTTPGVWPWATFAANIVGAFALGWVAARTEPDSPARALLGTGVCGALTTFSTLQLELLQMLDAERIALALGYALASVAVGLAAVMLGRRL